MRAADRLALQVQPPGQMRQAEPSLSPTIWLLSCFLICIADLLRTIEPEPWLYIKGAEMPAIRHDFSRDFLVGGLMRCRIFSRMSGSFCATFFFNDTATTE